MSDYSFLLAIAGVLLFGAMSPGPSFFVVAQNALLKSRAHGVCTALGTGLGVALFAVLASLGVTRLLSTVPSAYFALKLFGGVYLLYLAYRLWRGAAQPLEIAAATSTDRGTLLNSFGMGLITQLSNPKTALVIASIFAAFVPANPPDYTNILVMSIAFFIDFTWYVVVAFSLSISTSRRLYQRVKSSVDRIAALFLGVVGVKLLLSKLEAN